MRFSVNKQDTGYQNYRALKEAGCNVDIFVDDEPVRDVVEADDLAGYVIRHARDKSGSLKIDGENFVEERVRGKVEIRISQPKPVAEDVDGE